ncbi:MAG: GAP family protein [Corynebacterium sp.]|uniref:GAP family protein n=1 Tax=Corynebacterium sp. TaxID=1720 RepID=UPI0026DB0259|nr:GAP family protein [Corynebacterium sp.]MDO4760967.1 GAP family protein [Corynebacterium sp.]
MLHAVTYALLDSLNVLLIGVVVAIGVMLPRTAKYPKIATLLIAGDWMGVFVLALATMFVFDGIGEPIKQLVESPAFGIILIVVGLMSIGMTIRGGDTTAITNKLLPPLQTPTVKTFAAGFVLGLVQSATSAPFFAGIAVLSAGDFSVATRYVGMIFYASLALSLPFATAVMVGMVRKQPNSTVGRGFEAMRSNKERVNKVAGYIVGVVLVLMGALHL